MSNIGKIIAQESCKHFFSSKRGVSVKGAVIEAEGEDWIVVRTEDNDVLITQFIDAFRRDQWCAHWCESELDDEVED